MANGSSLLSIPVEPLRVAVAWCHCLESGQIPVNQFRNHYSEVTNRNSVGKSAMLRLIKPIH
ncbi:unnamed protein product [Clonostachys rosea f. rosea IK726]|uniref:Uncharacterized protein n=1 Tax=Clonostachys rosea f. rosea IK726 TaxID=1349383 RepID=A0ACA9UAW6_BIOOC|nr:unnamed protein product [Clonostachys rosea f. rosea IK726]